MKLFAQHGFSDGLKTVEGLRKELIDGVIFSPRDITPEKLRESASKCTESAPISERLFDPQYYATLSALDPLGRIPPDRFVIGPTKSNVVYMNRAWKSPVRS